MVETIDSARNRLRGNSLAMAVPSIQAQQIFLLAHQGITTAASRAAAREKSAHNGTLQLAWQWFDPIV